MMRDCLIVLLVLLFATTAFAQSPTKAKSPAAKKAQSSTTQPAGKQTPDPPAAAKEGGSDLDKALNMWEKMGKQTQPSSAKPASGAPTTKAKEGPAKGPK